MLRQLLAVHIKRTRMWCSGALEKIELDVALVDALGELFSGLLTLRVAVKRVVAVSPQQQGELDQLLHDVHHSVEVARGVHASGRVACEVARGHRRLVWDGEHTHPAPQHTHLVNRVKGLRTATNLHHGQSLALTGADGPHAQRYPIDLRFENAGHGAVALG